MLKRISEIKKPAYMRWWMSQNKEAYIQQIKSIRKVWDEVVSKVNDGGQAVTLMVGLDMVGVAVPPIYLYEFHRKLPQFSDISPIKHVPLKAFKSKPADYLDDLDVGVSLVVFDEDGHLVLGVSSSYFAYELVADKQGKVGYRESIAKYMFNDAAVPRPPKLSDQEKKETKSLRESWGLDPLPKMGRADKRAVACIVRQLNDRLEADGGWIDPLTGSHLSMH